MMAFLKSIHASLISSSSTHLAKYSFNLSPYANEVSGLFSVSLLNFLA